MTVVSIMTVLAERMITSLALSVMAREVEGTHVGFASNLPTCLVK